MHQILRSAMLDLFLARESARLVTIESPSGSGKSTLLCQLQAELFSHKCAAVLLQPNVDMDALALGSQMLDNLALSDSVSGPIGSDDVTAPRRHVCAKVGLRGST